MSTVTRARFVQALALFTVIVVCALCLQPLYGCASKSGDDAVIDQAVKYANIRTELDMTSACVVRSVPDAKIDVSVTGFEDSSDGMKEIELEPAVVSDTMAAWSPDEWALNRDDLYFNFAAHFTVTCKQAHELGNIPENYEVTCPDYMVVYNSQKTVGFIVSATGVYQKTDDPENPIGDPVVLTAQG